MINWNNVSPATAKEKAFADVRKLIVPKNYGTDDGQWNMTDLILDDEPRKHMAYQVLDGVTLKHKHAPGLLPMQDTDGRGKFLFRLRVLTRQACCKDKEGHRIFVSDEAFETMGGEGDILPSPKDTPHEGDVVEWKGQFRTYDEENGRKVTGAVLREWAARGIRPESYVEFPVDSDGCIWVSYPHVQMMLRKKGANLAFPKFKKTDKRRRGAQRKLINWWFEEVPRDYKAPQKRRAKKSLA